MKVSGLNVAVSSRNCINLIGYSESLYPSDREGTDHSYVESIVLGLIEILLRYKSIVEGCQPHGLAIVVHAIGYCGRPVVVRDA